MIIRRTIAAPVYASLVTMLLLATGVSAKTVADQLNQLGPEGHSLASQAGVWDVTETAWAAPDARPTVTKGVAVRRMVGPLLEETLHPGSDATSADISRIDYLSFNRVEGRWNYVSMDVRAPVGIMAANSFERDPANRIQLVFAPFALPGTGTEVSGQLLRMDEIIETQGDAIMTKDQHFIVADGSGRKWLAHRYAYTRRQPAS